MGSPPTRRSERCQSGASMREGAKDKFSKLRVARPCSRSRAPPTLGPGAGGAGRAILGGPKVTFRGPQKSLPRTPENRGRKLTLLESQKSHKSSSFFRVRSSEFSSRARRERSRLHARRTRNKKFGATTNTTTRN